MKKLVIGLALLLLVGPPVHAEVVNYTITYQYDLDATTTTYCRLNGYDGGIAGSVPPIPGTGNIKTTGSSTTVEGVDASQDVFNLVAAGDVLLIRTPGTNTNTAVVVTSKTDADTVVVNTAVNAGSSSGWSWLDLNCGTTATDGWFSVSNIEDKVITVQSEQQTTDGAGIDVVWECRAANIGSAPIQVFPDNTSAAAVTNLADANSGTKEGRRAVNIPEPWADCRVGLVINTADDGADAVVEQITIGFVGIQTR